MQVMIGRTRRKDRGALRMALSMPFIYGMAIPLSFLDITTQIYQRVCFPLYGIALVDRKRYVRCSARAKLLPRIDRFNCWYCAYANGSMQFVRAVLEETEKYWCPIRHLPKHGFQAPHHHTKFAPANDLKALEKIIASYPYEQ
jgi:hypothetical protein